jgi:hypothetical protein
VSACASDTNPPVGHRRDSGLFASYNLHQLHSPRRLLAPAEVFLGPAEIFGRVLPPNPGPPRIRRACGPRSRRLVLEPAGRRPPAPAELVG